MCSEVGCTIHTDGKQCSYTQTSTQVLSYWEKIRCSSCWFCGPSVVIFHAQSSILNVPTWHSYFLFMASCDPLDHPNPGFMKGWDSIPQMNCTLAYLPCSLLKGKQEHSFLKNNSLSRSLHWINFVFIQAELFIWHINSLKWLIWKCSVHINIQSICMCVWWTLIYYGHIENVAWVVDNKLFCWNIVFWTTLPLKGVSVLS